MCPLSLSRACKWWRSSASSSTTSTFIFCSPPGLQLLRAPKRRPSISPAVVQLSVSAEPSEVIVEAQVDLLAAVQVNRAQLADATLGHFGAGVAAQIAVAGFQRGIGADVLQDTGLQTDQVADVAVTAVAAGFVFQFGQTGAGTPEQAGAVAQRDEHVIAADEVLLAQLEAAAVIVRNILVCHVVAGFVGHLTGTHTPGAAVLDGVVEAVFTGHILLQ